MTIVRCMGTNTNRIPFHLFSRQFDEECAKIGRTIRRLVLGDVIVAEVIKND